MSQTAFASDAALVVQGLLIFSAAIVGVIGYYVQSKLAGKARQREIVAARKEHLRQLELARVREKLDTFIGPVSHLFHSFSSQLLELMSVLGLGIQGRVPFGRVAVLGDIFHATKQQCRRHKMYGRILLQ